MFSVWPKSLTLVPTGRRSTVRPFIWKTAKGSSPADNQASRGASHKHLPTRANILAASGSIVAPLRFAKNYGIRGQRESVGVPDRNAESDEPGHVDGAIGGRFIHQAF